MNLPARKEVEEFRDWVSEREDESGTNLTFSVLWVMTGFSGPEHGW